MQPMDTRQYLYCLKPKKEFAEKAGIIKGVTVIGKLDIVWKTNLGERGRLQTSQLQRMVSLEKTSVGILAHKGQIVGTTQISLDLSLKIRALYKALILLENKIKH